MRTPIILAALAAILITGGGAAAGVWMAHDGAADRLGTEVKDAVADADADAAKLVRQDQPLFTSSIRRSRSTSRIRKPSSRWESR